MMHRRATPDHHHDHDHEHAHGPVRAPWRPHLGRWVLFALLAWTATGVYIVQPSERAVVWRCGRILPNLRLPGIHFGLPWGIDRVTRLKLNEQKRVGVGLSLEDRNLGRAVDPRRAECLAGDRNMIIISAIVQYDIVDPRSYLVQTADVSLAIENLSTAELSAAIAGRDVDDILTLGRLDIQKQVLAAVRKRLAEWEDEGRGLGVRINALTLETVRPPQEVEEAFRDVIAAREDRQRAINEAQGVAAALIPSARGEAGRILMEAEGAARELTERARGEADRFTSVAAQLAAGRDVALRRLVLETLEEVLPRLKKIVLDDKAQKQVDLGVFEE
jgi:modulator of FtsH protease HflK